MSIGNSLSCLIFDLKSVFSIPTSRYIADIWYHDIANWYYKKLTFLRPTKKECVACMFWDNQFPVSSLKTHRQVSQQCYLINLFLARADEHSFDETSTVVVQPSGYNPIVATVHCLALRKKFAAQKTGGGNQKQSELIYSECIRACKIFQFAIRYEV